VRAWVAPVLCIALAAFAADEPLDPDKAFRPTARLVAGDPAAPSTQERHGIDIEYRIAKGYYLYRDRLRFEVTPASLMIGPAEFPAAVEVEDPFVGKSAIYRRTATIHLPFLVSAAKPGQYSVRITAQGCAESVFCYSPFRQLVTVNIPPGYRVVDSPSLPAPANRKRAP
jgi:thiol:disulfide interchange protein DsbD